MIDPAFTLEKKIAIVVGAANGIGRATALAYAAAGAKVACADVEEPGAKTTAAEIEAGGGQALPVRRHRWRELPRRGGRHGAALRRARRAHVRRGR